MLNLLSAGQSEEWDDVFPSMKGHKTLSASQNQRKLRLEGTAGKHLVQPPAQSRDNFETRLRCSGHFPVGFSISPRMESPPFLGLYSKVSALSL